MADIPKADDLIQAVVKEAKAAVPRNAVTDVLLGNDSYTSGRYDFEFDADKSVGIVTSLDGGQFKAEPMMVSVGHETLPTRLPGKPKFEDITLQVGAAMAPSFYKWMSMTLNLTPERRSGALVAYDFRSHEKARRTFMNAVIAEIGFPSLDKESNSPAYFTIKISPEQLSYEKASFNPEAIVKGLIPKFGIDSNTQKQWSSRNFAFELDVFRNKAKMRKVAKIDAFSVKQQVIENRVGYQLEAEKHFGRIEMPSLSVTFPAQNADGWMEWWNESVRHGHNAKSATSGSITYQSPTKKELLRLDLYGVNLMSLDFPKFEPGKAAIATARATLTVDTMKIHGGSSLGFDATKDKAAAALGAVKSKLR